MPLPDFWIDRIHGRLLVRYGAAWIRMWEGIPPEAVKADWAEELSGLSPQSIAHALDNLPVDRPPNVQQFRDICRNATPQSNALTYDRPAPNPERLAELRAKLPAITDSSKNPRAWLDRLKERQRNGERLNAGQRDAMARAERTFAEAGDAIAAGGFTPIPDHLLPPGMRKDAE